MNPTNKQGLREQIRKTSNAACNSVAEDGSFNTDEYLSEETRLIALITAHTNAEIAKVLDTIESAVLGEVTDEEERYEVYTAIQAERAKGS